MSAPFRPTRDLSSSRSAALAYIKVAWAMQGRGPSARDVAGAIGADPETSRKLLRRLEADGLIIWHRGQHGQRSEVMPADPQERISVPDALGALRRASTLVGTNALGELLRAAYPLSENPLPMVAVLSHLDTLDGWGVGDGGNGSGGDGG